MSGGKGYAPVSTKGSVRKRPAREKRAEGKDVAGEGTFRRFRRGRGFLGLGTFQDKETANQKTQ